MRTVKTSLQFITFILITFFALNTANYAQPNASVPGDQLKLGQVTFPTSTTSPSAAAHFVMGLKYLHNFMYPLALREFKLAQQDDPTFALSYWGMAMCYKWSLWSYENKMKGQQILNDFHALKEVKMTPLEQGLMHAIELIYGSGTELENEKKYMQAMGKLHEQYPSNPDVASLYALAMIGYANDTPFDKGSAQLLQDARQVLQQFFKSNPENPGVIHYYMHANDLPNTKFSRLGLAVVNNAYQYMSDSSHAMHMPSHLYTDLGWWSQASYANELSIQAGHHVCQFLENQKINLHAVESLQLASYNPLETSKPWDEKERLACDADNIYHSLEWLQYEYLQMGQFKKAKTLLDEMTHVANVEQKPEYDFWQYRMQARQILYTNTLEPLTSLPEPLIEKSHDKNWAAYSECGRLLADGMRAIHNKQVDFLPKIEARYEKIISLLTTPSSAGFKQACRLNATEVAAMKAIMLDKNLHKCTEMLDHSLAAQYKMQSSQESLTLPYVPEQEFYGEVLLQDPLPQNLQKAIKLYENELLYNPNRAQAILGLARAEAKAGNVKQATRWHQKLLEQYQHADKLAEVTESSTISKN